MRTSSLAALVLLALSACSGQRGAAGADGTGWLVRTVAEAAGAHCASGGAKVEAGADQNRNQVLDAAEVASTLYVCNGADGLPVAATPESPGANCPTGGVKVASTGGTPTYVCSGAPGSTGSSGQSVTVMPEPAGASCAHGGQKLQVGAAAPTYVCDGAPGATGTAGESVALTPEPAGASCAFGGQRLQVGAAAPTYVCDGATGATGESVAMTPEPAGANCTFGGQRLQVGAGAPTYVCDGATGVAGESVAVTPEPAGTHCTLGGQRLQVGTGAPTYVCNGATGATGAAGESVAVTPEPAGASCPFGGQKLQVGAGDPTYVCSGATGPAGEIVTMTPEPPGTHCALGGVRLQIGGGPASYVCGGAPIGSALPTVVTVDVTARYAEATVNGSVTDDGNELIFSRGVALATHAAPTLHDTLCFSGPGAGPFAARCDALEPGTTYYVRAFATNALGTAYGEERFFSTLSLTVPTLSTQAASNLTDSTALSGGDITDDGGTPILGRGLCWALAPNPGAADTCVTEGLGAGPFIALLTGLPSNTALHVRAYAINAQGTAYGDDRSFTTILLPLATVTTSAPSGVSYTTASGGGTVVDDHGAPVSSRGICWATTTAPTRPGTCTTEAGGLGSFTASMTGLAAGTRYYLRAYAGNGGGTSYGNELTFTTLATSVPVLTTRPVGGLSSNLAGSGGVISTDGGSPITAKGVCWSLNPAPTIANAKTTDGTGSATYNSTLTGLNPLTTYRVRAYATNALGTAYGDELAFTTTDLVNAGPTVPVLGTSLAAMATSSTATGGGYVSNDGGSPVAARGVCWGTAQSPALGGSCSTDGGTGLGYFASTITGIGGCGVVYYVRAYATNATGTGYGNQATLSTGLLPVVTTAAVTAIGTSGATSGGTIVDDGGCAIAQKGVVWSWIPGPTTSNPKTTDGAGGGSFSSSLTGLYANRTYYVRGYATNSVGTTYGPQVVFATAEPSTPYLGQSYAGGIVFYVDGTGLHGLVSATVGLGYVPWGCPATSVATGTAVGTGATNTAAIVAACGQASFAAKAADDLSLNGYTDWFLPSRDELTLVYTNLYRQGLGAFSNDGYWSSSEASASSGAILFFWDGTNTSTSKSSSWLVNPVRAF